MDVHPTKNVSIGIDPYPSELVNWGLASFAPTRWTRHGGITPRLKNLALSSYLCFGHKSQGIINWTYINVTSGGLEGVLVRFSCPYYHINFEPHVTSCQDYFKHQNTLLTGLTRHSNSLQLSEPFAPFPASNDSVWAGFYVAVNVCGSPSKTP